jgi:signal transduction histidine kinase
MVPQPLCNSHRRVYRRTGLGNSRHSQIVVSIKDTGTGIDPEIMPRLFSKFVTKSQSGTGLGLFISKSIIEAHGGTMWASKNNDTNQENGRGALFTFNLPLSIQ